MILSSKDPTQAEQLLPSFSSGCPGYNGTVPIPANRDCVTFLTALQNAPSGGTVNFTDLIRFDSTTCGSFALPFVIDKSVTITGASANPLYNTLDAFNNAAIFRIRGAGTRVFLKLLQLTRGVVRARVHSHLCFYMFQT